MRVVLYGLGRMGAHHARHLAGHDLVVIDPARGLTPDPGVPDAVVVATPTPTHAEVALPWLRRGVPCLVEKPLADDRATALALAAHPGLMVGHVERFNPAFRLLQGVDARFVQAERLAAWAGGAVRGADVDVILDLMIHDLDLFLALASDDPVVDVRANGTALATDRVDIAHARVELASGRTGTFTASRVSRAPSRRFRVFAPGEYWSLDLGQKQAVRVAGGAGGLAEVPVEVPAADALGAEIAAFLAFARGEGANAVPGEAGAAAVDLAIRVRDAIRG